MFESFRDFIDYLETRGELARIKEPVNPYLEVNRLARESLEKNGPALYFEDVVGNDIPVVSGLFGNRERIFDVLDMGREDFEKKFNRRLEQIDKFPPQIIDQGPVKERIITEKEINLDLFPLTKHGKLDGGWYISAGVCVSKDPHSMVRNASFHRLKKQGRGRLGIWMAPFDLRRIVDSYWVLNKPCPLAVTIGADPYTLLAACTSIPSDQDEFALAGALKGAPIELVPCETVPLEVPAFAELILEGWIHPNDELEEGPFAETSGYYSDPKLAPVITLSAITSRENPVFHDIVTGIPPDENQAMLVTHQAQAFKLAHQMFPDSVLNIYLTQGGCTSFNAVVRMKKRFAGEPKQVGVYMLTVMPRLKNIWVVDEDIDSGNPVQVEWAYTTRCRGSRDIMIINGMKGVPLDPCTVNGVVDKLVFDCTKPFQDERIPGEREVIPCF